jgi:outer membrane protein assembly factor BamB
MPKRDLEPWRIRSPLANDYSDPKYDWRTMCNDFANAAWAHDQGLRPPFRIKWIRRYKGTVKHSSVCGGRRLYTHTAEGPPFAVEQETGRLLWANTEYSVRSACTVSAADGRLYLGGYMADPDTRRCYVWCLDARDGALIWRSDPLPQVRNVVAVGERFLMTTTQSNDAICLLDKQTGKIVKTFRKPYMCTRYTLAGRYMLGPNLDVLDTRTGRFLWSGPAIDPNGCVGSILSNGRIFFTSQAGGLQVSLVYGLEAESGAGPCPSASVGPQWQCGKYQPGGGPLFGLTPAQTHGGASDIAFETSRRDCRP